MPNCDFDACEDDAERIVRFVFSQDGWSLWELASRADSELRQFSTLDELLRAFDLSAESVHLQLHTPEMGGCVHAKRITFDPQSVPDATFRYDSSGWGLIQLYLIAPRNGRLGASHSNHNSERRARGWEPTYDDEPDRVDDWDWKAVSRISSGLNRFIRSQAVGKSGSRPVLPCAQAAASERRVKLL